MYGSTSCHKASESGQVENLEKLRLAKELQLKPEELKYEVFLFRDKHGNTSWHKAAESGQVEILEILWIGLKNCG